MTSLVCRPHDSSQAYVSLQRYTDCYNTVYLQHGGDNCVKTQWRHWLSHRISV